MAPHLARIDLYPVKSLDGATVKTATALASGALQHDRAFVLVDQSGRFINAKRFASMQRVRSRFSDDFREISLWLNDLATAATFQLMAEKTGLEQWFSDYFQRPVTLQHNGKLGFPDDTASPGPTVISTATLKTVAEWYGLSLEESRRRFRTNLEIDDVPAFWEDQLFSASGEPVPFQIGEVIFWGINPCQRCVVPTRDADTGEVTKEFQQMFRERRAKTLPQEVARSRFDHFYRLAINTQRPPDAVSQSLAVGDSISLL